MAERKKKQKKIQKVNLDNIVTQDRQRQLIWSKSRFEDIMTLWIKFTNQKMTKDK